MQLKFDNEKLISAAIATSLHLLLFIALALSLHSFSSASNPPKFIKLRLGQVAEASDEITIEKNEEVEEKTELIQVQALPELGEVEEESAIEPVPKPQKQISPEAEGSEFGNSNEGQKSATYLELLQLTVQETSQIPAQARAENLRGDAVLRLTFNRSGYVRKFELVHKTGHKILDNAALDVGAKLSYQPFPPMPDNFERGKKKATYDFPISFKP